jgi:hypothetical protein
MRRRHASGIVRPRLRQIERAVNEGMALPRGIAGEHAIWQLVILPAEPVYCRATPQDALPCFKNPVSSITSTASSSASLSSA